MALEARELCAAWPGVGEVLRAITLHLKPGTLTALIGPNGAGKSTLLRALAGLVTPTGGAALLDGRPLTSWSLAERARQLGFLPQEVQTAFPFTVEEAVALGARVAGHGHWTDAGLTMEARAAVARALSAVEAAGLAARRLDELSGGERRRVLVASVLAQEPRWLLLDEPAAMLDLRHQAGLFRLLRKLADEGLGVVCVTHDLNLATRFAQRMILLHEGAVTADDAPAQVLRHPALRSAFASDFDLLEDAAGLPAVLPRA
jgi:iron complex transport system ATP-binding protein